MIWSTDGLGADMIEVFAELAGLLFKLADNLVGDCFFYSGYPIFCKSFVLI